MCYIILYCIFAFAIIDRFISSGYYDEWHRFKSVWCRTAFLPSSTVCPQTGQVSGLFYCWFLHNAELSSVSQYYVGTVCTCTEADHSKCESVWIFLPSCSYTVNAELYLVYLTWYKMEQVSLLVKCSFSSAM